MKDKLLMILVCVSTVLWLSSSVLANPYLAISPMTPEVIQVNVDLNGQTIHVPAANIIKRTDAWLLVDLSTIGAGSYTAKANADYGEWGLSAWSADFLFVKPTIAAPAGMRLDLD